MQVADGAAKPRRGQVQRGNTCAQLRIEAPAVLFIAAAALYAARTKMESAMRMIGPAILVAMCGMLACGPARAGHVPPFKGNDTGGIIAFELATQSDVKLLAVEHCARYGKVVKFLAAQAYYGGYISFACRWVPYGATERPLSVRY
jgi:hypothetical protein